MYAYYNTINVMDHTFPDGSRWNMPSKLQRKLVDSYLDRRLRYLIDKGNFMEAEAIKEEFEEHEPAA